MSPADRQRAARAAARTRHTRAAARSRYIGRPRFGFSHEQWPFVIVLVSNWIFAFVWLFTIKAFWVWQPEPWNGFGDRLALIFNCSIFAILPGLAGVAVVAAQRLDPAMWVGQKVRPNSALDINTRYILNTFEQFTLYFIAHAGLCLYAVQHEVRTVPIFTGLFLLGRILFWIGYHKNPYLRAFGFGLTFYPTFGIYVWLMFYMVLGIYIDI